MCSISKHKIWSGGVDIVTLKFTVERIGVSQSNDYNPKCCADIKLLIVEVEDLINLIVFFGKCCAYTSCENQSNEYFTNSSCINVILEWYDIIGISLCYII